jgi:hypothetical protein
MVKCLRADVVWAIVIEPFTPRAAVFVEVAKNRTSVN